MFNKINNYKDFDLNYFWLALPLLTADHGGDVGEHGGVYHEHYQDWTCARAVRTFIF